MSPARALAAALCGLTLGLAGPTSAQVRDGAHDFDFIAGAWHTRISRILDPFEGGHHTETMDGTVTERKVWGGKAWLEEIEADGPGGHWSGMTVFLYDPHSGQWSQTYAGADDGRLNPPTIGSFHDGTGQLYGTDSYKGRQVLLRGTWSDITPDAHTYSEAYSDDGGKSWEPVFIAHLTRIRPQGATPHDKG